jgi:hypothetical protein
MVLMVSHFFGFYSSKWSPAKLSKLTIMKRGNCVYLKGSSPQIPTRGRLPSWCSTTGLASNNAQLFWVIAFGIGFSCFDSIGETGTSAELNGGVFGRKNEITRTVILSLGIDGGQKSLCEWWKSGWELSRSRSGQCWWLTKWLSILRIWSRGCMKVHHTMENDFKPHLYIIPFFEQISKPKSCEAIMDRIFDNFSNEMTETQFRYVSRSWF